MSWQAYVDTSLVGSGHVDKAAIFSAAGDSVWATSAGFTVQPKEIQDIVKAYSDPKSLDALWGTGIHIGGEKFVTIKADDRSLYGKKGREGVVLVKTKMAILVTHYPEAAQPGNAATTVENLADYLIKSGY